MPALSGRVIDQTGTLTEVQQQVLDTKLAALEQEDGVRLLFTDIVMPGSSNGYQLAREARQRRRDPRHRGALPSRPRPRTSSAGSCSA